MTASTKTQKTVTARTMAERTEIQKTRNAILIKESNKKNDFVEFLTNWTNIEKGFHKAKYLK